LALIFERADEVPSILAAILVDRSPKTGDDSVVDLLNGRAWVLTEQERLIDDRSRRHARDIGIGWNRAGYGPVAAAGAVARGIVRRALSRRDLRRRGCILNTIGL